MKKYLILICLIYFLFTTSCGKKDTKEISNNPEPSGDKDGGEEIIEKPVVTLNQEYYVIGETINLSISNYESTEFLEFTVSSDVAIEKINNLSYKAKRVGEYSITITSLLDETVSTKVDLAVFSKTAYLEASSENIAVGDEIDLWFSHFNDLREESIDDFTFSINNDLGILTDHTLKALKKGNIVVTATSKLNSNVTATLNISIVDPDTNLILHPEKRTIKVGDIIKVDITGGYDVSDLVFLNSDTEVLRVTKYDTSLEVSAVGEGIAAFSCYGKNDPYLKAYYNIKVEGYSEVDYISRFIHLAFNEIGTCEGKDEKGEDNNVQKYGEWYNNNGQPWCATFVSWCWFHAGLSNNLLCKYQGCEAGKQWCVEHGIFKYKESYTPKAGDIVFFLSSGSSHTGIVAYCDGTYIYTIEGNRSNCVDLWRLSVNTKTITGYGVPNYPTCSNPEDMSWIKNENYHPC